MAELIVLFVSAHQPVPPEERRRIIAVKVVVMKVMKARARVTGYEVERVRVWYVVTAMYI